MYVGIEVVRGDMFARPHHLYVNPVNCVGVMGAGLALRFKQRFPEMFLDYHAICKRGGLHPGLLHIWNDTVINFPTKTNWRESSRLDYIESGLDALHDYLSARSPSLSIAIPALGCGLGGLNWIHVRPLIVSRLSSLSHEVYLHEP